jgi:hypothetical protein
MSNQVQIANLNNNSFVDNTSRYKTSLIYYYGSDNLITFETYKKQKVRFDPNDRFYVITKGSEFRPDLVANKVYGVPSLWWRIMEANDIKDIWDFRAGLNIRIPAKVT